MTDQRTSTGTAELLALAADRRDQLRREIADMISAGVEDGLSPDEIAGNILVMIDSGRSDGMRAIWFELKGDARLGRCASEHCGGQPTWRLEADGVGSNYCSGCKERIEAQPVPARSDALAQLQPQWQPIESAPKDGTRVWVFVPDFDPNEYVATYAHTDIPKEHPDYWEGWSFADEVLLNHCSGEGLEPSHWMPLPDSPALPSTDGSAP